MVDYFEDGPDPWNHPEHADIDSKWPDALNGRRTDEWAPSPLCDTRYRVYFHEGIILDTGSSRLTRNPWLDTRNAAWVYLKTPSGRWRDFYMAEVVWTARYARTVPPGFGVSHLSGVPSDNRIENLYLRKGSNRKSKAGLTQHPSGMWYMPKNK